MKINKSYLLTSSESPIKPYDWESISYKGNDKLVRCT